MRVRGGGRRYAAGAGLAVLFASAALVLGASSALAASPDDLATRFHVDIRANEDGSLDVAENITWHFPDGEERHGIERYVTVRVGYQDREDTFREYPLSHVTATSPSGAPADVSITDATDGSSVRIRVGRADETVSGTQTYVVRYHLGSYVNGFTDHAEVYYNLVDASDDNVYEDVSATVTGPGASDRAECFIGEFGSTQRCTATPGPSARFSAAKAGAGQGVSILASLPRDGFGPLEPVLHEGQVSDNGVVVTSTTSKALGALAAGAGVTLPLLAAGLMGTLVYTRGRDEQYAGLTPGLSPVTGEQVPVVRGRSGPVAVRFTPPDGVQPGLVGTVIDETANTIDVSATIIDLAARGHLTIAEEDGGFLQGKDWRLTRTTPTAEQSRTALLPYEEALLVGLFESGPTRTLSSLKNHFKPTLGRVQQLMYDEVVRRGWFRRSPESQRATWTALGGVMVVGSFLLFAWLNGPLSQLGAGAGLPVPPAFILLGGLVLAGLIVGFLGRRMAARTAEGSAVLAQSEGFKQYLVTAEATQIKWEEAQDIFSRYLPYAIVFGVASQWAATFRQVAEAAAAAGHTMAAPLWYVGSGAFDYDGIARGRFLVDTVGPARHGAGRSPSHPHAEVCRARRSARGIPGGGLSS